MKLTRWLALSGLGLALLCLGCEEGAKGPVDQVTSAVIRTNKGDIEVQLFREDAPRTVVNFATLAQEGYYDNMRWHRVESGFVIQTGQGDERPKIPDEVNRHKHAPGVLAMAKPGSRTGQTMSEPDGASTQFYINMRRSEEAAYLNAEYTVFGRVTSGMSVVRNITTEDKVKKITVK